MPERVRMQRRQPRPRPDGLDDLPDPLARDPALDALTDSVLVRDHEERRRGWQPGSLGSHVVAEDGARRRRQGHGHLVTALADDPTKPEVRGNVPYVQRCYLTATKPSVGHEGEDGALPEITLPQQHLDRVPRGHGRDPRLATRACEPIHRIADQLVAADHPLAKASEGGHAEADRAALELAPREVILVAPTGLLGEMRQQHRTSHLLHDKRQEIPETPPIRGNRRWGRPFFDPEKLTELLEQGGQAHRLPPRVRHALRRSMRRRKPRINGQGRWRRGTDRRSGRREVAATTQGLGTTNVGAVDPVGACRAVSITRITAGGV